MWKYQCEKRLVPGTRACGADPRHNPRSADTYSGHNRGRTDQAPALVRRRRAPRTPVGRAPPGASGDATGPRGNVPAQRRALIRTHGRHITRHPHTASFFCGVALSLSCPARGITQYPSLGSGVVTPPARTRRRRVEGPRAAPACASPRAPPQPSTADDDGGRGRRRVPPPPPRAPLLFQSHTSSSALLFSSASPGRPPPLSAQMKPVIATSCVSTEQSRFTIMPPPPPTLSDDDPLGGGGGTLPVGLYHVVTLVCTL